MEEEITTLNVNGGRVTANILAWIAQALERDGAVKVVGVATDDMPGGAAYRLGEFMAEATQAKKDGKF